MMLQPPPWKVGGIISVLQVRTSRLRQESQLAQYPRQAIALSGPILSLPVLPAYAYVVHSDKWKAE